MTDEQKQALIEQYRDFNVEHIEWWDCVYGDFTCDMAAKGIHVYDMSFSGFCSQGDGASFTGYISNNKMFFEQHGLTYNYPWITKLMSVGGEFTLSIERGANRRYVHENTVGVGLSVTDMFYHILPQDDLRAHVAEQWDGLLTVEYDTISGAVTEIIRDYCRDLYRRLRDEYDYLTSDEAVWDAIVANELDVIEDEETV